jgi:hypothetical protein
LELVSQNENLSKVNLKYQRAGSTYTTDSKNPDLTNKESFAIIEKQNSEIDSLKSEICALSGCLRSDREKLEKIQKFETKEFKIFLTEKTSSDDLDGTDRDRPEGFELEYESWLVAQKIKIQQENSEILAEQTREIKILRNENFDMLESHCKLIGSKNSEIDTLKAEALCLEKFLGEKDIGFLDLESKFTEHQKLFEENLENERNSWEASLLSQRREASQKLEEFETKIYQQNIEIDFLSSKNTKVGEHKKFMTESKDRQIDL